MIRVLRVIEYHYPNAEIMSRDMSHWTIQQASPSGFSMRSAHLNPEWTEDEVPVGGTNGETNTTDG